MSRNINILTKVTFPAALMLGWFTAVLFLMGCGERKMAGDLADAMAKEEKAVAELSSKIEKKKSELEKIETEKAKKTSLLAEKEKKERDEAIRKYEEFLGNYPISPYTPDVLIALGELYLERSEEEYVKALDEWQVKSEDALSTGSFLTEPAPQPHYEKTIAGYQQITLKYKDYPFTDVAYYGLGYCLQAQGEFREAAETFYNLCKYYPESKFVPEAYFRIGEYYFDTYEVDHYKKAISYYEKVPPETDFYDKALYKIGWAWYNMGDIGHSSAEYENAINAFTTLIEKSGRESVLTDEAMEFSAISITEWSTDPNDETAVRNAITNYETMFEGGNRREYSANVLQELGDVYLYKQDKIKAAVMVYEALLAKYPDYEKAPAVLDSLIEAYLRDEDHDGAHQARIRIVDNYGPDSAWYQRQKDLDVRNEALKKWENSLYEVAVYFNQLGDNEPDEGKNRQFYEEAINRYNQYLTAFPTNSKAYHINFFLATSYDAVGDGRNAGDQYQKTALGYTDEEHYEIQKYDEIFTRKDAMFSAVVAFNEIFRAEADKAEKEPLTEEEEPIATADLALRPPADPQPKKMDIDQANLVRACNVFLDLFKASPEIPLVLSTRGEVYFYMEDFNQARSSFEELVNNYPLKPAALKEYSDKDYDKTYVDAWNFISRAYYREAEYYEKLGDAYLELDPTFAKIEFEKASEKYGLAKTAYGRTQEAAKERQILDVAETSRQIKGYCGIKEAELLVKIGKSDMAIAEATLPEGLGLGIGIEETFPGYEETALPENVDVLGDLAIAKKDELTGAVNLERDPISGTETNSLMEAAKAYEQNAQKNQGTEVGKISLGKAAETYDRANDYENAGRVYLEYAKAYPEAEDSPLAWNNSAEMYEYAGDYKRAAEIWLEIANKPNLKNLTVSEEGEMSYTLGEKALFQAAVCYELAGDLRAAVDTYRRYDEEYQEKAIPRIKATFRIGRAEEKLGNYDNAIESYKRCAGIYKLGTEGLGLDLSAGRTYVAESAFKMNDINFAEYDQIQLVMPQKVMEANLARRIELSKKLIDGYKYCENLGEPEWTVAAKVRKGDVNLSFKEALMNAEVPPEIAPERWENLPLEDPTRERLEDMYYNYVSALDEQALPLEDNAVAFYTDALDLAEVEGIDNDWTRKAEEIMLKIRPYEMITYQDVGTSGVRTAPGEGDAFNDWLVSYLEEPGWTTAEFDDLGWSSAEQSFWNEKDEEKVISVPPGKPATVWGNAEYDSVYLRRKFSLPYMPEFELHVQARGAYKVYINGELVGASPAYKDGWTETQTFDPKPYLRVGDNVIAVYAERDKDNSYGVRLSLRPAAGFPEEVAPIEEPEPIEAEEFGEFGVPEEYETGTVPEAETEWMGEMEGLEEPTEVTEPVIEPETYTETETPAEEPEVIDFTETGTEYGPEEEETETPPAETEGEWFEEYGDVFSEEE